MYKIEFYKNARIDYENIKDFIAQDNLYYAIKVLENIDKSIGIITEYPFI